MKDKQKTVNRVCTLVLNDTNAIPFPIPIWGSLTTCTPSTLDSRSLIPEKSCKISSSCRKTPYGQQSGNETLEFKQANDKSLLPSHRMAGYPEKSSACYHIVENYPLLASSREGKPCQLVCDFPQPRSQEHGSALPYTYTHSVPTSRRNH